MLINNWLDQEVSGLWGSLVLDDHSGGSCVSEPHNPIFWHVQIPQDMLSIASKMHDLKRHNIEGFIISTVSVAGLEPAIA